LVARCPLLVGNIWSAECSTGSRVANILLFSCTVHCTTVPSLKLPSQTGSYFCFMGATTGAHWAQGTLGAQRALLGALCACTPEMGALSTTSTSQEQPQPARSTQVTALVTRQTTGADRQAQTGHAPQCLLMEDVTAVIAKRPLHFFLARFRADTAADLLLVLHQCETESSSICYNVSL